ncbi:MAG: ester cyclase [Dehalococcoidales bacterium]|nr:ester cyclase [Dehalococcoidales bacterium]
MDIEKNRNLVKGYYSEFNKGSDVHFEDYFSPSFIDHNGFPDQPAGPAGVKDGYEIWTSSFPDTRAELADIITEGDRVVVRTIATGTHLGDFQGIAPTGKKVRIEGISIFRVSDGMIQERWGLTEGGNLPGILRTD